MTTKLEPSKPAAQQRLKYYNWPKKPQKSLYLPEILRSEVLCIIFKNFICLRETAKIVRGLGEREKAGALRKIYEKNVATKLEEAGLGHKKNLPKGH